MKQRRPTKTLRQWRHGVALTQTDAARLFGVSQSYYSKVELGQNAPNPRLAKRIADKTGVPLESVLNVA